MAKLTVDSRTSSLESAVEEVGLFVAPKTMKIFRRNGYNHIGPRNNAALRIQEGLESPVFKNGNYLSAWAYGSNGQYEIFKGPTILEEYLRAVQCTAVNKVKPSDDKLKEARVVGSVSFNAGDLLNIPSINLGDSELGDFLFEDMAEGYGKLLYKAGIERFTFDPKDRFSYYTKQEDHIVPLWFNSLRSGGGITGVLDLDRIRIRGVRPIGYQGKVSLIQRIARIFGR